MQELIVLGQIPGTDIQINFSDWVHLVLILFGVIILFQALPAFRAVWHGMKAYARSRRALKLLNQYHLL